MRFGIMSTQMDLLTPPGLQADGLAAHLAGYSHADLVRDIAANGFDLIEISGDLAMILPHHFTPESISELSELKTELGISLTVHLPLWSVETSTPVNPVRQGSVQALIESIEILAPLGPEIYVLHGTGALAAEFYRMSIPDLTKSYLLNLFQNGAKESVRRILGETGISSRRIAVETIEFPLEMTLALAEEFDLSICFDTGHVLAGFSGRVDFFEALERCLPRIGEFHLHDCLWSEDKIGYGKDHKVLGKGDLDFRRLIDRLDEAGFDGPVIFELKIVEALESLGVIVADQG